MFEDQSNLTGAPSTHQDGCINSVSLRSTP